MKVHECLFCKIVHREIPATILYEDEQFIAFDDIQPQAPIHKLVIPKTHIPTLNDLKVEDAEMVGNMLHIARTIALQMGIEETGYRCVFNCNEGGGQAVYHIHLHLLGGRKMEWPPG